MATFGNKDELRDFLTKINPLYGAYSSALYQAGVNDTSIIGNSHVDYLTSLSIATLHATDLIAKCKTIGTAHNQPTAPTRFKHAGLDHLWRELAECKEENGFIALPKGLKRILPLVREKLMVRECYIKLVKIVEERSGVQLLPQSSLGHAIKEDAAVAVALEKGYIDRAMIVTGTPGIGKSMWLILLLILMAKGGICVVLDSADSRKDKFLLSKDGCFSAHEVSSFGEELDKESTFLLSDSRMPDLYPAMTILVSSPSTKIFHSYNEKAEDFYMPVWSLEEIVKLRNECYPHRSESDVLELYACWGGIVRWVLERPNTAEWRRKLHQVANAMDNDKLEKACCAGDDDEISLGIFHYIPTADLTGVEEIRLATSYVSDLVCCKLERCKADQVVAFLERTRGDQACRAMRGQLLKSYDMYRQSESGEIGYAAKPPQGEAQLQKIEDAYLEMHI